MRGVVNLAGRGGHWNSFLIRFPYGILWGFSFKKKYEIFNVPSGGSGIPPRRGVIFRDSFRPVYTASSLLVIAAITVSARLDERQRNQTRYYAINIRKKKYVVIFFSNATPKIIKTPTDKNFITRSNAPNLKTFLNVRIVWITFF